MFDTADQALTFITGGKATFTIQSAVTGDHFTFTVNQAKAKDGFAKRPFFVRCNGDFLGTMWQDTEGKLIAHVTVGKRGINDTASHKARKALTWVVSHLIRGSIHKDVTIQHEGTCCVCARPLTNPESIASGIGPICAARL